jgi:hypothetical protein
MSSTFSDFDARQEQSWNPENFGKVTAQLVLPQYLLLMKMPGLDWAAMLMELGRSNFHFPDLERFHFLISIYRAAGKASAFTLQTLLAWPELTARYSAVRLLIRVPKEIFDVLAQSENFVLTVNDFAQSSPLVKDKATFLASQNLNSLDLCHSFFLLQDLIDDPNILASLREDFRNNVELLTLAGSSLSVCHLPYTANIRNHGQTVSRIWSIVDFNSFSEHKGRINCFSPESINSTQLMLSNPFYNYLRRILIVSQGYAT